MEAKNIIENDMTKEKSEINSIGNLKFWRKLFSNKAALFGVVVIVMFIVLAFAAPLIAPYPYDQMNSEKILNPPNMQNIFGTDEFGRDIFSRIIYGARASLKVGFIAVGISMVIGTVLGALAGYYGGIIDYIIGGITDIAWSFPVSLLAIALAAALGPSFKNLIIAVALVSWSGYTRLIRGQFLSLRETEFIEASRVLGMSDMRIIFKHMLPNSLAPLIVLITMEVPKIIIVESSLSFLGLGVQPPTPSWGSIMSSGRSYILEAPWISMLPGLTIVLLVMGFNLFGDSLRDTLDPRLK